MEDYCFKWGAIRATGKMKNLQSCKKAKKYLLYDVRAFKHEHKIGLGLISLSFARSANVIIYRKRNDSDISTEKVYDRDYFNEIRIPELQSTYEQN